MEGDCGVAISAGCQMCDTDKCLICKENYIREIPPAVEPAEGEEERAAIETCK
jgi:hypothetical protein